LFDGQILKGFAASDGLLHDGLIGVLDLGAFQTRAGKKGVVGPFRFLEEAAYREPVADSRKHLHRAEKIKGRGRMFGRHTESDLLYRISLQDHSNVKASMAG
jgi:hypothetical protein